MNTANFNDYAKHWWDPQGPMAPLHHIHPVRMQFIKDHLPDKGQIWDAGCAGGLISLDLAEHYQVVGSDIASDLISAAKQRAAEQALMVEFRSESIMDHPVDRNYNAIICSEVLEHLDNPYLALEKMSQHLRAGGTLILSTINRSPTAFFGAIVAAEYVFGLLPRGTHRYHQLIQPQEISQCLCAQGMSLRGFSGIHYNPWSHSARLCRDTSINYLMAFTKNA